MRCLANLGVDVTALFFKKGNSIWCFIICTNAEQLKQLYKHYQSGLMEKVLEEVFVLLADKADKRSGRLIRRLTWDLEDFTEKRRRLKRLKDLGKSS
jgi:HD superfamily phosphohydrolase